MIGNTLDYSAIGEALSDKSLLAAIDKPLDQTAIGASSGVRNSEQLVISNS